jgi:hypothetical protein
MNSSQQRASQIDCVWVRTPERDPVAARRDVARVLDQLELEAVPRSSILIVRRLPDPRPGELIDKSQPLRPRQAWERAVQQEIDDLHRKAARPDGGRLPDDAETVLFRDEAELLASLALDIAAHRVADCWWWRSFRNVTPGDVSVALTETFWQQARFVPAAVRYLADWDRAGDVVPQLEEAHCELVLREVADAFAVTLPRAPAPGLRTRPGSRGEARDPHPVRRPDRVSRKPNQADLAHVPPPRHLRPAWWSLVERLSPRLTIAQRRFLAVCLLLHHEPVSARDSTRLAALDALCTLGSAAPRRTSRPATEYASLPGDEDEQLAETCDSRDNGNSPSEPRSRPARRRTPDTRHAEGPRRSRPVVTVVQDESIDADAATNAARTAPNHDAAIATAEEQRSLPQPAPSADSPDPETGQVGTEIEGTGSAADPRVRDVAYPTELGGLLYLLNVFDRLDLLHKTGNWRLNEQTGPWVAFEGVCRALLGVRADQFGQDGLWAALAELDGREPAESPDPDQDCTRWLSLVTPSLKARLTEWLDIPPDDKALDERLWESCFHCAGAVRVSATHVDLVTSLEAISLPVRRAGLDRNPGWLSDFGRVITFWFI